MQDFMGMVLLIYLDLAYLLIAFLAPLFVTGEQEQMQIEGYSLATFQAASAALLCLKRDSLRTQTPEADASASSTAQRSSLAQSPGSSGASPSSSATVPTTNPTEPHPPTSDSPTSSNPLRRSWIGSVLAEQANIPLSPEKPPEEETAEVDAGDGNGEEEEWSFFMSASEQQEDDHESSTLDFEDTFQPDTNPREEEEEEGKEEKEDDETTMSQLYSYETQ